MAEKFRQQYGKSIKYENRKNYDPEENSKTIKKLTTRFGKKFFYPELAFGKEYISSNTNVEYKIAIFLFFILTIAILATVGFLQVRNLDDFKIENNIFITIMSVSWFAFITMLFLVFDKTRELNITLFVLIVILSGYLTSRLNSELITSDQQKTTAHANNISIAVNVLCGILLLYLLYYYARKDPIEEILDLRKEKEDRIKKEKLIDQIRKAQKEAVEQEKVEWGKQNIKSEERLKIIEDSFKNLKDKKPNTLVPGPKKSN